jgi:hypothetical protein
MEMLRAAIKHGISKALSTSAGFEVWDFDIKEEQPSPERATVEIRYRYHPGLYFNAAIVAMGEEGQVPTYEISAEAVPGEVGEKETLRLAGRQELFKAIERWTTRIEEELSARPSNRVLAAQQKAIAYLEKHLLDIPDAGLTREQIIEYRRRLERLEAAVIELRAPKKDLANGSRADAVRQEFAALRSRLEVLGERSFLHAVLVRLVKYFWDDENLRIIEAGSRAAQDFLRDEDHPLSAMPKAESAAAARAVPKPPPQAAPRVAQKPPPLPPRTKGEPARAVPRPETPAFDWATGQKAEARPAPKAAAKPAPAKPETKERPAAAKPDPKPAQQKPEAPPAPTPPERLRAAYKPLRPGRG